MRYRACGSRWVGAWIGLLLVFSSSSASGQVPCQAYVLTELANEDSTHQEQKLLLNDLIHQYLGARAVTVVSHADVDAALTFHDRTEASIQEQISVIFDQTVVDLVIMASLKCPDSKCIARIQVLSSHSGPNNSSKPLYVDLSASTTLNTVALNSALDEASTTLSCTLPNQHLGPSETEDDRLHGDGEVFRRLDTTRTVQTSPEAIAGAELAGMSRAIDLAERSTVILLAVVDEEIEELSQQVSASGSDVSHSYNSTATDQYDAAHTETEHSNEGYDWGDQSRLALTFAYQRQLGFTGGHGVQFNIAPVGTNKRGWNIGMSTGGLPITEDVYMSARLGVDYSLVHKQWFQLGVRSSFMLYLLPIVVPDLEGEIFMRAAFWYVSAGIMTFNPGATLNAGMSFAF